VEDLAKSHRGVTCILEHLWQRNPIGHALSKFPLVIENAGLRRMESRQKRRAGWIAQRVLAVRPIKSSRNGSKFIDVRRLNWGTVATKLGSHVVTKNEENVQFVC
jgi:hypothetical protein